MRIDFYIYVNSSSDPYAAPAILLNLLMRSALREMEPTIKADLSAAVSEAVHR